jgi:hypothetical protein
MSRCCVVWKRSKRALYRVAEMEGVGRDRLWRLWVDAGSPYRLPAEIVEEARIPQAHRGGYTVDGVHYPRLEDLAAQFGKSMTYYHELFKNLGRYECTSEELCSGRKAAVAHIVIVDGQEVAVGSLRRLWPEMHRTASFFRHAWNKMGRPTVVTKEMFVDWQEAHRPAHNRVDFQAYDSLPHIVQGDLAHLSGTGKNTGAGKGEIPHEEWVGRIGGPKAINSSVYGITLAAFNR